VLLTLVAAREALVGVGLEVVEGICHRTVEELLVREALVSSTVIKAKRPLY
jgi:hypothetical protein